MATGYSKQIQLRIHESPEGSIFVNSDFADIADTETIRRNLNRLTKVGILRRIINGIYEKPKYSKLLDEYVAADPAAVAQALARSYHWTIAPCGNTALNLLGLSTQVTAVWSYISDGPYKTYEWNSTKLEFKHRTNKEITGLSYMTSLVIQALKTLGKNNITPEIIQTLSVFPYGFLKPLPDLADKQFSQLSVRDSKTIFFPIYPSPLGQITGSK